MTAHAGQDPGLHAVAARCPGVHDSIAAYGILSVGADELQPYWAPRNNTFVGNDVFGSVVGCADDFQPGQWSSDQDTWSQNNCAGKPDALPIYF